MKVGKYFDLSLQGDNNVLSVYMAIIILVVSYFLLDHKIITTTRNVNCFGSTANKTFSGRKSIP